MQKHKGELPTLKGCCVGKKHPKGGGCIKDNFQRTDRINHSFMFSFSWTLVLFYILFRFWEDTLWPFQSRSFCICAIQGQRLHHWTTAWHSQHQDGPDAVKHGLIGWRSLIITTGHKLCTCDWVFQWLMTSSQQRKTCFIYLPPTSLPRDKAKETTNNHVQAWVENKLGNTGSWCSTRMLKRWRM